MKIAIYGGSFNPVHNGHIAFANLVSNHCDEVWLMPCKNHAFNKDLAETFHRAAMTIAAVKQNQNPKVKVSFFEIFNESNGSSYETLLNLKSTHPEHEFYFAIGIDCAAQIKKWKNSDALIVEFPFIVVNREGFESEDEWFKFPPHVYIEEKINGVSSTEIRDGFRYGDSNSIVEKLNPVVFKYIEDNGLYGAKR